MTSVKVKLISKTPFHATIQTMDGLITKVIDWDNFSSMCIPLNYDEYEMIIPDDIVSEMEDELVRLNWLLSKPCVVNYVENNSFAWLAVKELYLSYKEEFGKSLYEYNNDIQKALMFARNTSSQEF